MAIDQEGFGDRQLSPSLWRGFDRDQCAARPEYGSFKMWDFLEPILTGEWTVTQATAGTFASTAGKYGLATADAGNSTDTNGANIQSANRWAICDSSSIVMLEARLVFTANTTGPEFFFGLHESYVTIVAAGALANKDYAGFFSASGNNLFAVNRLTGSTAGSQDVYDLATDGTTYINLGIRIERGTRLKFFINGDEVGDDVLTSIPALVQAVSIVMQSNGTTRPTGVFDWIALGVQHLG